MGKGQRVIRLRRKPRLRGETPGYRRQALRRASTALAVEESVTPEATIAVVSLPCFGGFRTAADDPPRPPLAKGTCSVSRLA